MTDEFDLFGAGDTEPAVDPDIALIAAYLAQELSLVQIVAVEERLVSDTEFRHKVQPILEMWMLPVSLDSHSASLGRVPIKATTSLTRAEIDAGWNRPVAVPDHQSSGESVRWHARRGLLLTPRKQSMTRVAAIVALVVLPLAGIAQVVVYSANHKGAPGHAIASAIVTPWLKSPSSAERTPLPIQNNEPVSIGDAPVQFTFGRAEEQTPQTIPVVELSAPSGQSPPLGLVLGIKEVSDGRLLVNDAQRRLIHLFAPNFASSTIAIDSAPGTTESYGDLGTALVSYLGDSSLIRADRIRSDVVRVLDGQGRVARAMAIPPIGRPGVGTAVDQIVASARPSFADAKGRLLFKSPRGAAFVSVPRNAALWAIKCPPSDCSIAGGGGGGRGAGDDGMQSLRIPDVSDSLPIQRIDLESRQLDTVGFVLQPENNYGNPTQNGGGKVVVTYGKDANPTAAKQVINPLQMFDDWAVLSDGTIAIVRGHDYHVDWILPDGTKTASPKLPYEWKRLTDDDKQRLIDSTRAAVDSVDARSVYEQQYRYKNKKPAPGTRADSLAKGLVPCVPRSTGGRGACAPPPSDATKPKSNTPAPRAIPYEIVPPTQIADYYPPIGLNSTLADRDGNLWILPRTTTLSKKGELVYDVVNPKRGLIQRVRLPLGRSIAGFAKGGVVILKVGDFYRGFVLERTTISK